MELISAAVGSVSPMQFEVFAVAVLLSAGLFSIGFLLGRSSKSSRSVKVPMEVLHALATTRFDVQGRVPHADKDTKHDQILHAVEKVLDHVLHHEKDFKHAQEYTLHELDKIAHDFGATPELTNLHHKVEAAHNKGEVEAALKAFIDHAKAHH